MQMDTRTADLLVRSEYLLEQSRACAEEALKMNRRLRQILKESDLLIASLPTHLKAVEMPSRLSNKTL